MKPLEGLFAPIVSQLSYPLIKAQLYRIWPAIRMSLLLCLGGVGATLLIATLRKTSVSNLVIDPAELMHFPVYIGMLSNWSIMLWTSAASICLFCAPILRRYNANPGTWHFLQASGILSLYFGLDDLFRLHDKILPKFTHISETVFYFLYLAVMLGYFAYFLPQILKQEFLLFTLAVALFVVSRRNLVDFIWFGESPAIGAILKYFGIVFWLTFFYRTAFNEINCLMEAKRA